MTSLSRVQAKRSTLSCNQRLRYLMFTDNERFCVHTAMYKCLHYTGPHLHTLLTSFVRWQMSRLVSDSVPCSSSSSLIVSRTRLAILLVTELSQSPLHVSGTVCQILSLPHLQ